MEGVNVMKISCCVIAKNEEANISKCLSSLRPFSDQIVLIDTGSTDRTVEIACQYNAQIHKFNWIDDFSAARNFALEQAKGDWIIFIDADECIEADPIWLRETLTNEKNDVLLCGFHDIEYDRDFPYASNRVVRIFRNSADIKYKRSIHEYLYKKDSELLYSNFIDEIKIFHSGYSTDEINNKNKYWRNLSLLLKELRKDPTDSEINFYLADTYRIGSEYVKALFHLDLALKNNNFRDADYCPLALVCQILLMKESNIFTLDDISIKIEDSLASYPTRAELLALKAILLEKIGDHSQAAEWFSKSIKAHQENTPRINYFSEIYKEAKKISVFVTSL